MSNYAYVAVDAEGRETRGMLNVPDQSEALRRIREMGFFPMKLFEDRQPKARSAPGRLRPGVKRKAIGLSIPWLGGRVNQAALCVFTRQLATLVEAGMPLLRGLRILEKQEHNPVMKRVLEELSTAIESGTSFAEAVALRPRVFNGLYVNMVKAGEIGGALEVTLARLAEFMEKARKIKGKVKAAMFYPCAVLLVATAILGVLMVFVVPRFRQVFDGLLNGAPLPAFTLFVFRLSEAVKNHVLMVALLMVSLGVLSFLARRADWGRWSLDQAKLKMPILGRLFNKAAISRFARTLGTLVGSGVPILQALTIVKETSGNVVVGRVIARVHDHVKEGDPIAPTLQSSGVFPAMVAGMVDVGEQTGALPEMLMKIADTYDEEVDNAASAMTSLLEPIMILFLAVVVGSIVIAMFLPLIIICDRGFDPPNSAADN